MTIHPLFVHFPIALLTIYSIIEIFKFRFFLLKQGLQATKKVVLYIGVIMAFVTMIAGLHDEDLVDGPATYVSHSFVEIHALFGFMTFLIFSFIAICYFLENSVTWPRVAGIARKVVGTPWIIILLAVIGLGVVFLTGALGGAIVYSHTDPFGQFLLQLVGNGS